MGTAASLFDVFLPRPRETTRLPGSFLLLPWWFITSWPAASSELREPAVPPLSSSVKLRLRFSAILTLAVWDPNHQLEEMIGNELANCALR